MANSIKYIGFYDRKEYKEDRTYSLAATNKMDYICSSLVKAGYAVEVISPAWTRNKSGYYKKRTTQIGDDISLTVCPTIGASNRIAKLIRILFSWLWLFFYLIFNVKKNEKIIVYHSLWLAYPVYFAKKIKRFKLILEIEEEYSVVIKQPLYLERIEKKIIKLADMHIYCNDLMIGLYEELQKPHVVIYGIYNVQQYSKHINKSGKINIIYAGIIDTVKAGAFNALQIAKYLPNKYELNIIGFGSDIDVEMLRKEIQIANQNNECQINFDGLKKGQEYIEYMMRMDVGLSTQTAQGEYLKFSFPSKILSYLSMGLRVVSSKIECVEKSQVGNLLYYYNEDTPQSMAEAIENIDLKNAYNSRKKMKALDESFIQDIKKLLQR
ncbi:glycosyltransferase [Bacillus mobilis]|uniref:glycosyltransferase n=1 Tax=Bacillus mobilis TaxID=2026190 RepID=UPI0013D23EA1|nr:glycosyltransferase [Bacillus mobilis]NEK99465.1 glycosyltransferase family 4 protein [Bacillus mobilis]